MNLLTLENISKAYSENILFKDISLGINSGDKIGLIGRNGEGKTTILRIISGMEEADSGEIIKNASIRIEYLPQNVEFKPDITILEQVFRGNSLEMKLLREYEKLVNTSNPDSEKLVSITNEIDRLGIWDLESEAKAVLNKLGINNFKRLVSELSGGQKRRIALASALITPSDLLILDEPTNHLDNTTIEWLEEYLSNRKGALLLVTHDRYFLDRVTNRIVELDNKSLYNYDGNYSYFLQKKLEREEIDYAMERKRRSLYRQELAWMRQGVKARGTRQKARVERFDELKNTSYVSDKESVDISVGGQRLGKKIIEIKNISKSFDNKSVIKDFTYTVLRDDRIGILGDNGAGKSTLMNLIAGRIIPDSGEIEVGETVKIGYFSQEALEMDPNLRAIEYIKEGGEYIQTDDGSKITAAKMMERFLFTKEQQWTPIEKMSGGERRRLFLLRVLMEGPNFLILDEPTNDLDIETLTVLEEYIDNFIGPVIVVSHDRYFLDRTIKKVMHIENSKVLEYAGNYEYFSKHYEKKEIEKEEKKVDVEIQADDFRNRELKFSYNEKREWQSIDGEIQSLEKELELIDKEMLESSSNYVKLGELSEKKEEVNKKLNEKLERWVYLSELKEKIDNQ